MTIERQHELGGRPAGALDLNERPQRYWEKKMEIMRDDLARRDKPILRVDEMRRAIEDLPAEQYKFFGPYQRKTQAIRNVLVEKGVLDAKLIESRRDRIASDRQQDFGQESAQHHSHSHADHHDHEREVADEFEFLSEAMIELLIEKGLITADGIRRGIERTEMAGPALGAQIVAKAWLDDKFKKALLSDGKAALAAIGIEALETQIIFLENTPAVHNMVVCTLCSCYPRSVLGSPPAWYVGTVYRSRAVREPRKVLEEFGLVVPADVEVKVHDSNADMRYFVIPQRPAGTHDWSESQLEKLVTRDSLIGVARALKPEEVR